MRDLIREHKLELLAVLSRETRETPAASEASGHWLILQAPRLEMYFTPPATRGELAERFPGALLVCLPDTTDPLPVQYRATPDGSR